jgi:nucleoid DNA-binding protein
MNKEEFVEFLSTHNLTNTKLTKKAANEIVDIFMQGVIEAIAKKETVNLAGFGSFDAIHINERIGTNPKTGERMPIKSYMQPKFKAGQKLKKAANGITQK